MLLSVTGPRDMKLPLQGLPRPLLLKLHRESTFTDLEYLTGQVFRFTVPVVAPALPVQATR